MSDGNLISQQEAMETLKERLAHPKTMERLTRACAAGLDPHKMASILLSEVTKTPKLLECSPESLLSALAASAQMGLEPGPAGLAHLIPRKGKAQFQADYKGLVQLAWRSDKLAKLETAVVRDGDDFSYEKGTEAFLRHKPGDVADGEVTHVYALLVPKGGLPMFEVMTLEQIFRIRDQYSYTEKKSPWVTAPEPMMKKTVLKPLLKLAPLSFELSMAVAMDDLEAVGIDQHNDEPAEEEPE